MPPRKQSGEDDEQDEVIPAEPSGKALTELRKRQKAGREAAEKLWNEIRHNIQHPKAK